MKKLLIIAISLLLSTSLFAQTFRIATFPFTGSVVTNTEEGEFLAGLFTAEFIPLGYTLVTRTTGLGMSAAEREYQTSGATAEIAEIGKQVAADYVLVGALNTVFGQISLKVEVIGVESSQIVASQTKIIDSLDDIATVSVEMVKRLNSQIKGINPDAPKQVTAFGDFATLTPEKVIERDLATLKRNKWIGRWTWIGGAVVMGIGGIVCVVAEGNYPGGPPSPSSPDYNTYIADENEYANQMTTGAIMLSIGAAAIIAGVITDIIFSGRENKLLEELESKGIYLSAIPTIEPDLVSGRMNYGVQLGLKYSF